MSVCEYLHGLGHAPDEDVAQPKVEEHLMQEVRHGLSCGEAFFYGIPEHWVGSLGPAELFEVEREHFLDVDGPDGQGSKVVGLDAEHRARVDDVETVVLGQIAHPGNGVGAPLDLVEEQQSTLGGERPFGKRGDAHDEIAEGLGFADDLDRSRLLDEVDLHHGFIAFASERLDAACFTRLASASDEKALIDLCRLPRLDPFFDFPLEHICLS